MTGKTALIIITVAALFLSSCSDSYFPPPESKGGWRKNIDPEFLISLGVNPKGVNNYLFYNARDGGALSALVIKDGWIVGEWYDKDLIPEQKIYVASIGKSFALACFAIAVKDGAEGRLPVAINRFSKLYDKRWLKAGYPLSDPRKEQITFDQVFQHTAGFPPERAIDRAGRNNWRNYIDWVVGHSARFPQTGKLIYTPGNPEGCDACERWGDHSQVYSSLGFAHIGLALRQLYGIPASEFLWNRLLEPIGFSGIDFDRPPAPPDIRWFTGAGLKMTTRDLARFAYFMMHDGTWNGRRLLPTEWVKSFVSTPYYPNLRSNVDGYFGDQYPKDFYRMFGSGGNFVFMVPSEDLIVITTASMSDFFLEKMEHDLVHRVFDILIKYRPL